jgi:hypothetical protein
MDMDITHTDTTIRIAILTIDHIGIMVIDPTTGTAGTVITAIIIDIITTIAGN